MAYMPDQDWGAWTLIEALQNPEGQRGQSVANTIETYKDVHTLTTKEYIDSQVEPEGLGGHRVNAFGVAIRLNRYEYVRQMIVAGVDVNASVRFQTPGMWASENVAVLPPLIHAIRTRAAPVVIQLLLDNNANASAHEMSVVQLQLVVGYTPLHAICTPGYHADAAHFLPEHIWTYAAQVVSLLIGYNADVNARTGPDQGHTPLHLAVQWSAPRVVKMLIDAGADVDSVTPDNNESPLHLALRNWVRFYPNGESPVTSARVSVVEMLLDAGANPNAKTKQGHTPLYYARTLDDRYHEQKARLQEIFTAFGADTSSDEEGLVAALNLDNL
jgi:ankyrin repeat protein